MTPLILKYITEKDSAMTTKERKQAKQDLIEAGENKVIDYFKSIINEKTIESIYKVERLADLVRSTKSSIVWHTERLCFASYIWAVFLLHYQYRIPFEEWPEQAFDACQVILEYLESDLTDWRRTPSYYVHKEKYKDSMAKFQNDPRYANNFIIYAPEMGN